MLTPLLVASSLALAPVVVPPDPPADARREQARDAGRTLRRVEELRRVGEYADACDELRGYLERWQAAGIGRPDIEAELARMRELMVRMVEIRELYQRAPHDKSAAGAYLRALVNPASPSSITEERARGIALLAKQDPSLRAFLDRAFPARIEMTVHSAPDAALSDVESIPFKNALVEMSRDVGLPFSLDEGAAVLRVEMVVRENDRANSILAGTAMRSYAIHSTARLEDASGARVLEAAHTTSSLGINPGFAARWGMQRAAQLFFEQVVNELAKRIERGDI